jgi:cell division protein FtsW
MRPRTRRLPQPVDATYAADLPRRHRPDYWLVIIMSVLLVMGLIVIYSISQALGLANNVSNSFYISRQFIAVLLGVVVFFITSRIPLNWWTKYHKLLLGAAALATLAALVLPVNPQYPAHRWVRLGSLSFQSVELVLFAVLIWLAVFLTNRRRQDELKDNRKTLIPIAIALGIVGVVVAGLQSDLGSMVILTAMMAVMAFVAGIPMKRLAIVGSIIVVIGVLAISITPYRRERLLTFLHPTSNCLTTGYQSCQALIAVGSGGLIGLGLGRDVQAYGYVPEAANDSIFAIFGEKFGFIGSTVLLGLFVAFFYRIKETAIRAPNDFTRLAAFAVLMWLSLETLINIGAMIGLLPLKGITLPFISYGGTSIIFFMAAVGLVFQISHYTSHRAPVINGPEGKRYDNRLDRRRLRGAYHPGAGSRA